MTTSNSGTFEVKSWDEKPLSDTPAVPKLTHASVTESLHGVIEGTSSVHYIMAYPSDTFAAFVGMQHVEGRVGGKAGSFLLRIDGTWEGGTARANLFMVPGAGTGELAGLKGTGTYTSDNPQGGSLTFDYTFG